MQFVKKYIFLIIVISTTQMVISQNFKTTVTKKNMALNEKIRIQFSIDVQGADDFTPPKYKNFKVVGGPFQSTNFQYINGEKSFEQSFTYIIQPKTKGKFTIPSATIAYKGKTLTSNKVSITVNDAKKITNVQGRIQNSTSRSNNQDQSNDLNQIAQDNIHLVAEISNTNPYVGENINVVYKLYMNRDKAAVSNERETKSPTYNGFWNQNIQIKQLVEKQGKYNGKDVSVYTLRKDVLIPQRAGKLKISPLEIDITAVVALDGRRDFFGRRLQKRVNLVLSTGQKNITVKNLPETNKPSNFSGAVGKFAFKTKSSKTTLKANESVQIEVIVSGTGNLKLLSLPKIQTPNNLEQYEPEHKENIRTDLSGLNGSVIDNYTIVPQYRGKYKIPSLSFSYFNPKTETYKTINSAPIILNVPEGELPKEDTNTSELQSKKMSVTDNDIRFIHTKTSFLPLKNKTDFFKSNLFYLLFLLPLLAIPIGIYIGKKKQERDGDIVGNRKRKADKLAKKYLSSAKKELGNKEPFYIALEKALHNYLKAKLQVETSEISKDRISEILKDKNVDSQTINQFVKVLDDCDFARYTPTSSLQMEKEYQNAATVINEIDKQFNKMGL